MLRYPDLAKSAFTQFAGAQKLDVYARQPLLFYPVLHATREVSSDTLRRAELIEFQKNDPVAAAALFREESRSRDPELRAAALVRLGRSLRKAGQIQEALAAYSELATMDSTRVSGLPAELVAREARCSLFEASARHDDLRRESESLLGDLENGRWRLTRSAYEFRAAEVRQWLGKDAAPPPADALAVASPDREMLTSNFPLLKRSLRTFLKVISCWLRNEGDFM